MAAPHYDAYGRAMKRGYYTGSDPGNVDLPTISTLLKEYFYIGNNGVITYGSPINIGKVKKSRIRLIQDLEPNNTYIQTENTFDPNGRVDNEVMNNHMGQTESKIYTFDAADNLLTTTKIVQGAQGITDVRTRTYDHQGREKYSKINLNNTGEKILSQLNYSNKSEIIERNIGRHATTGTHQYLQSMDYSYNAQGWLIGINDILEGLISQVPNPCDQIIERGSEVPDIPFFTQTDQLDLFSQKLNYATGLGGGASSLNGNINSQEWIHRGGKAYNDTYSYTTSAPSSIFNRSSYNGKEMVRDMNLNWLDYDNRNYDATIGRFTGVDRLSKLYSGISPFVYVLNNPLIAIDPDGDLVIFINGFTPYKSEQGNRSYWGEFSTLTEKHFGENGNRSVFIH
jgi:RHS repeat-associated protein